MRSAWVSRVSSFPFVSSSPLLRTPTLGASTPSAYFAKTSPMIANWTRCDGRQSTVPPASRRIDFVPLTFGMYSKDGRPLYAREPAQGEDGERHGGARVARRNHGLDIARLQQAEGTLMEESFFLRRAVEGDSFISTAYGAWTISMPDRLCRERADHVLIAHKDKVADLLRARPPLLPSRSRGAHGPRPWRRWLFSPYALEFFDRQVLLTLVVSALRADPMGQGRLLAIRAKDHPGGRNLVVRPPLVSPRFRCFSFRDRHDILLTGL